MGSVGNGSSCACEFKVVKPRIMALGKTYFKWYYFLRKELMPLTVDKIEYSIFLYLDNSNPSHCFYATFLKEKMELVQYSEKWIPFKSFMSSLFQYANEDELVIEDAQFDLAGDGGYQEKRYSEHICKKLKDCPYVLHRIDELSTIQTENVQNTIGRIKGHTENMEQWHSYLDSLFDIKEEDSKDGMTELESSWDRPDYAG
jgi:hypothetical protein